MHTIAELPEYIRRAEKLLSENERQDLIRYLADHPKAGDLMEGTGGIRKLRWGAGWAGEIRRGAGDLLLSQPRDAPFLLTLFAKNERANLSKAERNALAQLVGLLIDAWSERKP